MKTRKFMAMIIAAVACLGAFTACGDDDNENKPSEKTVTAVEVTIKAYISPDLITYADVKGTYTVNGMTRDASLSTTTEKVKVDNGTTYDLYPLSATYTFQSSTWPSDITMNISYTSKGITPTEKVSMNVIPDYSVNVIYSDGTSEKSVVSGSTSYWVHDGVQPDKFETMLSTIQKTAGSLGVSISSTGAASIK